MSQIKIIYIKIWHETKNQILNPQYKHIHKHVYIQILQKAQSISNCKLFFVLNLQREPQLKGREITEANISHLYFIV